MINSTRFYRRQEGGNDSNQYQIQNFSVLQSDRICIADTTSFSKKNYSYELKLLKYEEMFDGTLGKYNGSDYTIESQENANPFPYQ